MDLEGVMVNSLGHKYDMMVKVGSGDFTQQEQLEPKELFIVGQYKDIENGNAVYDNGEDCTKSNNTKFSRIATVEFEIDSSLTALEVKFSEHPTCVYKALIRVPPNYIRFP